MESYRETRIKERLPEMENRRERHSRENPRDGVPGRQRRERRQREDSHKESPRRVEIPPKTVPRRHREGSIFQGDREGEETTRDRVTRTGMDPQR